MIEIVAIAATTIAFWLRSSAAGILMLPHLGWVAVASVVNMVIRDEYGLKISLK